MDGVAINAIPTSVAVPPALLLPSLLGAPVEPCTLCLRLLIASEPPWMAILSTRAPEGAQSQAAASSAAALSSITPARLEGSGVTLSNSFMMAWPGGLPGPFCPYPAQGHSRVVPATANRGREAGSATFQDVAGGVRQNARHACAEAASVGSMPHLARALLPSAPGSNPMAPSVEEVVDKAREATLGPELFAAVK
jgi:hypothetical protein